VSRRVQVLIASAALAAASRAAGGDPDATPAGSLAVKTAPPATVGEILSRAEGYVVAILVERAEDVGAQNRLDRFSFRRASPEARAYRRRPAGFATGILLDADGHVLTSLYNVAGDVKSIAVRIPGREPLPARVVSRSPHDDLALLKLDAAAGGGEALASLVVPGGFQAPVWADAEARAGTFVLALGRSPDPERLTVTKGIVSAGGRSGGRLIQTDAELNYGNTGGPLVDLDGRIVAVASFVGHTQLQWGLNSGVGFGATAATVLALLPRMKEGKDIEPPRPPVLGVRGDPDEPETEGARIRDVTAGSGAAQAGIRAGDVIIEIDGTALQNFHQLRRVIFEKKPGDLVKAKVRREGGVVEVEARLGTIPP
jgi:S1-C subfamily serine protease